MWIRSQNKLVFVKINDLFIRSDNFTNATIENEKYIFGTYQSIERALEILNEIQDIITKYGYEIIDEYDGRKHKTNTVYEMPQE